MTSSKTLSVAALVVPQLAAESSVLGRPGIALVVCVFVYLIQLAIDFFIASAWMRDGADSSSSRVEAIVAPS